MLVLAALGTAACGVPEQKYKAAVAESERSMQEASGQRARADACDQKVVELSARAEAGEKRAGDLSGRLAQLEQAVSAASAAAAGQRQLASRLADEKSALQKRSAEYEALASSLDQEIKAGRIQLTELQGKVTVRMAERVLFPSGSATIAADGKRTLQKVAEAFKDVKGRIIRVEGHTDNVPIHTERFPSNWELSSARAIAVVRFLQDRGVDPAVLAAAGYAEFQPIAISRRPLREPSAPLAVSGLEKTIASRQDLAGPAGDLAARLGPKRMATHRRPTGRICRAAGNRLRRRAGP
jgi:chemotaxis protein MotB